MADPERYQSALTGPEMDQALLDMANHTSERFAKGTANGVAVEAGTDGYNDNSLYYKNQAASQVQLAANQVSLATAQAARAENAADRAEAAVPVGTQSAVLFTTAQTLTATQQAQARANIMAGGSNPNLLDNPWFTVNQRNVTSGGHPNYVADRWETSYGSGGMTWERTSDGAITFQPTKATSFASLQQILDSNLFTALTGKIVTFSALLSDNTIYSGTATFGPNVNFPSKVVGSVRLQAGTGTRALAFRSSYGATTVKAVKLELGTVSTLANDMPPNYAEELAKCQKYYINIPFDEYRVLGVGACINPTLAQIFIPLPVPLRATPTVTVTNSGNLQMIARDGSRRAITSVTSQTKADNGIYIRVGYATYNITEIQPCTLYATGSGSLSFSADL